MLLLGNFSIVTPDLGLLFWTTLIFLMLWFLLGRYAFKPIVAALKDRENSIQDALSQADRVRQEMSNLQADNHRLLAEAKVESALILQKAKEQANQLLEQSKDREKTELKKMREDALAEIETQKTAAINDIKNMIGRTSVDIAAKVLGKQLNDTAAQEDYIMKEIEKIKLN